MVWNPDDLVRPLHCDRCKCFPKGDFIHDKKWERLLNAMRKGWRVQMEGVIPTEIFLCGPCAKEVSLLHGKGEI